ncbi:MAG: membrane protein insertase YidC, partial [Acidobacteria bacterium]|nr:membrane protein insertase YidC [Acidobacteriota bacterium]MDW7985466.1 membrane protein insertase YidC [Acidobacteriota bacterium]
IKALQEKYKGIPLRDPRRQKMNEELMRIYREYGVNPMSGCLPLLLQLPILFAFYSLLSVSIELRQAPFVFWIRDLSRPDPYLITPILMGITMILQQKLTPTTMDPTHQRLGYLMSGLFIFMFMNAQSGLVLYWLFSNVFSIAQQYLYHRFYFRTTSVEPARRRRLKVTQVG